eukprot:s1152_g7.t1
MSHNSATQTSCASRVRTGRPVRLKTSQIMHVYMPQRETGCFGAQSRAAGITFAQAAQSEGYGVEWPNGL